MVELIWDGKYKDGKRVQPVRLALPFQTIETVNESAQQRQTNLFSSSGSSAWRNRLIWGDKKYVLPSLLEEFAGKVNLIYIDPPFATGANFSFTAQIPDDPDTDGDQSASFTKQPSMLEEKAYRDTWGKGLDGFMQWFYETASILVDLLEENGSLYVHLDDHVSHYAKAVLDELLGVENFRDEIIWQRTNSHNMNPRYYLRLHDVILFYTKSSKYIWNTQFTEYSPEQLKRYKPDEAGRLFTGQDLTVSSTSKSRNFEWRGSRPAVGRAWALSLEELEKRWEKGEILKKVDGAPRLDGLKIYLDETSGKRATDLWNDIARVGNTSDERMDYPTQKPEALLERIIKASSNEGDLVLDCFCGSGTTAATAEKLGRRWITCDLGRYAIHTARKRLLSNTEVMPFVVQNLGKYERQAWQAAEWETLENAQARESAYRGFILDLYDAQIIGSGVYLHGLKAGRMVHVGSIDSPVTQADVNAAARELLKRIGTGSDAPKSAGLDVLGWDFAFELNETGKEIAADAGVDVKFRRIPREVLERKAVEQGDIKFFELAALSVSHKLEKRKIILELKDFMVSPDDVPQDVQNAITHWSQWIDYWAIDWNYREDTFHNEWQAYRTRKVPKLETKALHNFEEAGVYTVLVKVIDLLGNDTTKSIRLEVK
jgi:adenine-specific DNA-methyltransferase